MGWSELLKSSGKVVDFAQKTMVVILLKNYILHDFTNEQASLKKTNRI